MKRIYPLIVSAMITFPVCAGGLVGEMVPLLRVQQEIGGEVQRSQLSNIQGELVEPSRLGIGDGVGGTVPISVLMQENSNLKRLIQQQQQMIQYQDQRINELQATLKSLGLTR